MSLKKYHQDHEAVQKILNQIDAIERKAKLMRQYINPETGTVDTQVFAGLWHGIDEAQKNILNLTVKFL